MQSRYWRALTIGLVTLIIAGTPFAADAAPSPDAFGNMYGHVWISVDPEGVHVAVDVSAPDAAGDGIIDHEFILFVKDAAADVDGLEFTNARVYYWPEKLIVRSRSEHHALILALSQPVREMAPSLKRAREAEASDTTMTVDVVTGYGLNHTYLAIPIDELRSEWSAARLRIISNTNCEAGGCGSSACSLSCPKNQCSTTCSQYFHACCYCQFNRAFCVCEIDAGC